EDAVRAEHAAVVADAEALADAPAPPTSKQWRAVERRWDARTRPSNPSAALDDLGRRFAAAGEPMRAHRPDVDEARGASQRENLARLEALATRLHELATADALKPATGRRALHDVERALEDLGPLPPSEQRAAWSARLAEARDECLRRVAQEEQ